MSTIDVCSIDSNEVFDQLIREITSAQNELDSLHVQLKNQPSSDNPWLRVATYEEEIKLWNKEAINVTSDDDQLNYYLAVGHIEKTVKELRDIKKMHEKNSKANLNTLDKLNASIKEQESIVKKLEEEVGVGSSVADVSSRHDKSIRTKLYDETRCNKMILRQLKKDLKDFIDETAQLDIEYNAREGACFGYFLQALWKNFLNNGTTEYVSLESLGFDVTEHVLQFLLKAEIIQTHPSDPEKIKLVDFTMS